jgi:hypothetical protein
VESSDVKVALSPDQLAQLEKNDPFAEIVPAAPERLFSTEVTGKTLLSSYLQFLLSFVH